MPAERPPLMTPDGRYIVVRGRLWRAANPGLDDSERQRLVGLLMAARHLTAKARRTGDDGIRAQARRDIEAAKQARSRLVDGWRAGLQPTHGTQHALCRMVSAAR